MDKKVNRNTKKELEIDIEYIEEVISYINENDMESAKQMLNDWKNELSKIKSENYK